MGHRHAGMNPERLGVRIGRYHHASCSFPGDCQQRPLACFRRRVCGAPSQ
jgi:hypothetical protein